MSRRSADADEARRRKKPSRTRGFRGFVNYTPTAEDKKGYKKWAAEEDLFANSLPTLLGDGYRLSLSMDKLTSAFMAAISTKDSNSINAELVLTARAGSDPWEAAGRAMFLHFHILEEVWPDPGMRPDYVDEWAVD